MVARCRRQAAAAWSGRANGSSSRLPACHIDVSSRAATASQPDRADAVAAWPGRASESSSRLPACNIDVSSLAATASQPDRADAVAAGLVADHAATGQPLNVSFSLT